MSSADEQSHSQSEDLRITCQNHSAATAYLLYLQPRVCSKVVITLDVLLLVALSQLALPGHEQLLHVLLDVVHPLIAPGASAEALHQVAKPKRLFRG